MLKKLPKLLVILLASLLVLNLLQAYFTELIYDEAYYWHYAQDMAWGYFDHPPMVAFLIKISSFFFSGELGVRFMSCILSIGSIVILWLLIDNPKKREHILPFFTFAFSLTLLNAYGFFTLPDTPLVFFTCVFLLVYKHFIKDPNYYKAILLGVIIAALMYSKYHAFLVVFFIILSNLKLAINKYAWIAVGIALLCYTPHFLWLYEHDFVSIKYHLYERPNGAYHFEKYTVGFFINLVAILGFTFPWVYKALYKTKATDLFTKALLYLTYGFIIFFFISSFNRRIQTQWVIIISIPLFILAYNYMLTNKNALKWIYRTAIINTIVLVILRIGLIYKPLFPVYYETHGNKLWVNNLHSQIGDTPVVFENSYRTTPMYAFYTGSNTFSLNNIYYRQNQYTIDKTEATVQNKKVLYVSKYYKKGDIKYKRIDGTFLYGNFIENFESYRKLKCSIKEDIETLNHTTEYTLQVYNPYDKVVPLKKLKFSVVYLDKYKKVKDLISITPTAFKENILTLSAKDTTNFKIKLPKSKMEKPSYFKISISENGLISGLNGSNIKVN
ncbi:dolichyl-phosphate-mannose-protein mannosyltransferase [Maribacter vaceletii]|uniref:Dolichyl-phosphate-mannose-protein mannosyltransferase n=1 Tax=Maribacter vaceletii TaxID=1206816 RepID=A0A495EDV7_9FLAO|nr:glycosyltransferase family 39 protein [Maribacter vaceletii]RKR15110.1 dolichyl-phosphate-mannose-protein mannosyltransferase [Maribacter vaceletii]